MHEDVWVVDLVIEVIELHGTALEGMLLVHFLFLLRLSGRHQNTLLEEVSRCHYGVSVKFSVVLDVLDPNVVCIGVMLRTNVRVSGALLYQMANFLAAVAPDVFGLFLRLLLVRVQVFLVVLLRFVTIVLAPWLVFILFRLRDPYIFESDDIRPISERGFAHMLRSCECGKTFLFLGLLDVDN